MNVPLWRIEKAMDIISPFEGEVSTELQAPVRRLAVDNPTWLILDGSDSHYSGSLSVSLWRRTRWLMKLER